MSNLDILIVILGIICAAIALVQLCRMACR